MESILGAEPSMQFALSDQHVQSRESSSASTVKSPLEPHSCRVVAVLGLAHDGNRAMKLNVHPLRVRVFSLCAISRCWFAMMQQDLAFAPKKDPHVNYPLA